MAKSPYIDGAGDGGANFVPTLIISIQNGAFHEAVANAPVAVRLIILDLDEVHIDHKAIPSPDDLQHIIIQPGETAAELLVELATKDEPKSN